MKVIRKIIAMILSILLLLTCSVWVDAADDQDETAPSWRQNTPLVISDGTASFYCMFDEAGTFKYIFLPAGQTKPSRGQVAAGQDADGNPAYYANQQTYTTANTHMEVTIDISNFAPNPYNMYLVCEDVNGNISGIVDFLVYPATYNFEITADVTFTVNDGAAPVEGALVKVGTTEVTTDADGKAVFTLPGGSYTYLITKTGFQSIAGRYNADKQVDSVDVTITGGSGGSKEYTITVQDSVGVIKGASVTIGNETVTTDAEGKAIFLLENGNYQYTIVSPGRLTKNGSIVFDDTNNTETVAMEIDPEGVTLTISNHVTGSLKSEVDAFLSANSIPAYNWIKHLVVSGGEINSDDTSKTFFYGLNVLGPSIKTIDFSATAFINNTVPGYAIENCAALSRVVLPDSVTSIGLCTFYGCSSLADMTLPAGLTSIGNSAFKGCSSLETIVIPDGVTTIEKYAFQDCPKLKDIYMNSSNPPTASWDSFSGTSAGAAVHVPSGSEANYCQQYERNKKWCGLIVEDPAGPAPELWASEAERTSDTAAIVTVFTDEPGECYFKIVVDGADEPVVETTGVGESFSEEWFSYNGNSLYTLRLVLDITGLETGPKDIYIKLKDLRGNVSENYKIDLEGNTAPIDVTIDSHQAGELADEIQTYMVSQGMEVNYKKIKSLTIKGATMNSTDWDAIRSNTNKLKLREVLEVVDLSEVNLENNCIPNYVFYALTKMGNVKLPGNIESIGEYAFAGCSSLASVSIPSKTPPVVGEAAFGGIAGGAAVYVPAGCKAVYKAIEDGDTTDNLWHGLTITEVSDESYVVSVFANPTDGGSVSGGGVYREGEQVTVTAYVYKGYSFVNWTDGGSAASISNPYIFSMETFNRTLTANFSSIPPDTTTGSIAGTVRDEDNRPVTGADVNLTVSGYVYSADTLTDGTYSILNVPEGTDYTLTANKTGYISGSATASVTAGGTTSGVDITITVIPQTHTVSFNVNGGSAISSQTMYHNGKAVRPADPIKDGYTFAGWYSDETLTTEFDFNMAIKADTVIYAKWTKNSVTLERIAITTPAKKLVYTVGEALDISGMVVTGSYSDGTTKVESITTANVTGFDNSKPAQSQTLTVTVGGKTAAYIVTINTAPKDNDDKDNNGSGGSSSITAAALTETPKTKINNTENTATAITTATATVDNNGKATAAVTQTQVTEAAKRAAEEAAKQGNGMSAVVEIRVEAAAAAKNVEVSLPKAALNVVAGSNTAALTVSTVVATITFDSQALDTLAGEAAADLRISAAKVGTGTLSEEEKQMVGDRPVYDFRITSGDKTISRFGGKVLLSIPYTPKAGEDTNSIVIYYINAEGEAEIVSNCVYDHVTGSITFTTNHFSKYAVGYNKVNFQDVTAEAWYGKAVGFIAARGITEDISNGKYSPEAKLTRGEFMVMIMRAYGIAPDESLTDNFSDAGSTYYTGYLAAAKGLGIAAGVGNNLFAPGKEITRQEMFTLLYHTLKVIGQLPQGNSGKMLSEFTDAGQIASWAEDAMTLLVETGTVSGSSGKLNPTSTTTRAEMAQVLYNLLSK